MAALKKVSLKKLVVLANACSFFMEQKKLFCNKHIAAVKSLLLDELGLVITNYM